MKNAKGLGKKKRGTHGTFTPLAKTLAQELNKSSLVTGISAGQIKTGLKSAHGHTSVKVTKNPKGALLLKVRDNISVMDIRVFGTNYDDIIELVKKIAKDLHINFSLEDRTSA